VALLVDARAAAPDTGAAVALDTAIRRIGEPLRVAIAGRVKAGKSTLLNALVGEELAPTDAGECTRLVTWYRHGLNYRVDLVPRDGPVRECAFRRSPALDIDLGGALEDVDHLVVSWPSARLEEVTLVDTPGIGSISTDMAARTYDFLADDEPSEADAVLYLLRHLHGSDVRFLEAFHDDDMVDGTPVNAVGVLSRADEIGGCRLGAMDAAGRVAHRYQGDERVRQLCRMVVPVAGLLAQGGATLREEEFRLLAAVARSGHDLVELALTADRFVTSAPGLDVPAEARQRLLARLGLFGVRVALDLIHRGVAASSSDLAAELVRRSGITGLREVFATQLTGRRDALKARSSLMALSALVRTGGPGPGGGGWPDPGYWQGRIERILSAAHEIVEIQLLGDLWLGAVPLRDEAQGEEMARLLGGSGMAAWERLGVPEAAPVEEQRSVALAALRRWLSVAEHPLTAGPLRVGARAVARSCEGIVAGLGSPR
jgi:hypothetical protein